MTLEQMAREAGMERDGDRWFTDSSDPLDAQDVATEQLERFAALVRAQALEDAARVCDEKLAEYCQRSGINELTMPHHSTRKAAEAIRALKPQSGNP